MVDGAGFKFTNIVPRHGWRETSEKHTNIAFDDRAQGAIAPGHLPAALMHEPADERGRGFRRARFDGPLRYVAALALQVRNGKAHHAWLPRNGRASAFKR